MVKMGISLSISNNLGLLTAYLLRVFFGTYGSVNEVGLYTAGFSIMTIYVNMVFQAMGTDYYPRLTKAMCEGKKLYDVVKQQLEISSLIVTIILSLFLILIPYLLVLLYSDKFIACEGFLIWSSLGVFLMYIMGRIIHVSIF